MTARAIRIAAVMLAACGGGDAAQRAQPVPPARPAPVDEFAAIALEPQRAGDPQRGYAALVTEGYVGCGVPRSLYNRFAGTGGAPAEMRIDRPRDGELPYFLNAAVLPSGVEVVTANCLGCHAGRLRGALVIGLGEAAADLTQEVGNQLALAGLLLGGAEKAELARFVERVQAVGPHITTRTVGANPADHIAAVLFAHRDPETLAWSAAPLIPLPTERPVPVDVPAWWLMKKKTAMFYNGAGRGDHARIMMTASVMCVDDVETAKRIDAYFPDIRAYILSLEPPRFPGPIDAPLAARGKRAFEATCARCHGTYGADGSYRSRVVPLATIGTDPLLARTSGQFAAPFTAWFNRSFYGELARLEPAAGYVPPPLDGVWATAPYLHNGSVPNLAALLDSSRRLPRTRIERRGSLYDLTAVGWPGEAPEAGTAEKYVYDTAIPGYANTGHTFGDRLTPDDRAAVIEYLKSL